MLFYLFFNVTVLSVVTISVDGKRTLNTNRETLNLRYYADNNLCPHTMKTKELIIDVRRKAFTHHPIHIDGTEVVLSLVGTLNCSNTQILRRPRLQTSCCTIESILTKCITVGYGNYWDQLLHKVVKTSHASSPHRWSITSFYWRHLQKHNVLY